MRKTLLVLLVLLMTTTLLIGTASATSVEDLTALAQYYPEDTTAFVAMRTDDGFIEELDGLVGTLSNTVPELGMEGLSLEFLLDILTLDTFGGTFDETVRTWLGDEVALGLTDITAMMDMGAMTGDMSALPPVLLAIEITDSDLATEFWTDFITEMDSTPETVEFDDFVVLDTDGLDVLIGDGVILLGEMDNLVASYTGDLAPLSDNDNFNATLAELPADDYNIIAYINGDGLLDSMTTAMEADAGTAGMSELLFMNGGFGNMAIGFALIDGRNLAIDLVGIAPEDMSVTAGYIEQNPVDLAFAENIPANAQVVIMDNNFGADFLAIFDMLSQFGPLLQMQFDGMMTMADEMDMGDEMAMMPEFDMTAFDFGGISENALTVLFAGLTGMNLRDDVLTWMEGDYATFLNVLPVQSELGVTLDVGFITETNDADATNAFMAGVADAMEAYNITVFESEDESVVIPNLIRGLFPAEVIEDVLGTMPELDVVLATDGNVFAFGTRPAVGFVTRGGNLSLADEEAFAYASETVFLDDTISVWFVNTEMIVRILPAMQSIFRDSDELQGIADTLNIIESLSFTSTQTNASVTVQRWAITLQDEPVDVVIVPSNQEPRPTMAPVQATPTQVAPPTIEPTPTPR